MEHRKPKKKLKLNKDMTGSYSINFKKKDDLSNLNNESLSIHKIFQFSLQYFSVCNFSFKNISNLRLKLDMRLYYFKFALFFFNKL